MLEAMTFASLFVGPQYDSEKFRDRLIKMVADSKRHSRATRMKAAMVLTAWGY